MREPTPAAKALQIILAGMIVALLAVAFLGEGGFADAYGAWQPQSEAAIAARRYALAAAAGRSLALGIGATILALGIGISAAWALARSRRPIPWLALCALPLALPASVAVSGWVKLFAPVTAASRFKVPIPGFAPESRGWLFGLAGAVIVLGCGLWPVVAFQLWPAFRRARNQSYDAARLEASRTRAFFQVVLPQSAGELAAAALLVFVLAFNDFSVSSLLLVRTLPTEIHDSLMLGKTASAAAAAIPALLLVLIAAQILARLGARQVQSTEGNAAPEKSSASRIMLLIGVILGFILPMAACAHGVLGGNKPMSDVFSVGADALLVSLRMSLAAALLTLVLAALRVLFWPQARARWLNAAALLALAVPGSFLAASLFCCQIWAADHLAARLAALLPAAMLACGYVIRYLYVPLRLSEEGLAALDPELFDAAAVLGQTRGARAFSIALPLVAPQLAAATALTFVLALGEVPLTVRLASPGAVPATVWLFNQQHYGYDEAVFGLSLLLGAAAGLSIAIAGAIVSVTALRTRAAHRRLE